MAGKKFYKKKAKNARLIIDRIKDIARQSSLAITRVEWDEGTLSESRDDYHVLKIYSDDRSIERIFFDEEIIDFPYESSETMEKIHYMVRQLKD